MASFRLLFDFSLTVSDRCRTGVRPVSDQCLTGVGLFLDGCRTDRRYVGRVSDGFWKGLGRVSDGYLGLPSDNVGRVLEGWRTGVGRIIELAVRQCVIWLYGISSDTSESVHPPHLNVLTNTPLKFFFDKCMGDIYDWGMAGELWNCEWFF